MPEKMTAPEVLKLAEFFEENTDHRAIRDAMEDRWKYFSLTDMPDLPAHMKRGDEVIANSPFLGWLCDAILSDMSAYPTTVTIVPLDSSDQRTGDIIEKACMLQLNEFDRGKVVTRDMRWHQLMSAYCTPILNCTRDSRGRPQWLLDVPSPTTCFFPLGRMPDRPKYMARRYKALVADAANAYANTRGGRPGYRPVPKKGKNSRYYWDWEQVGDDYDVDHGSQTTTVADGFAECEIVWVATETMIYHVLINQSGAALDKKPGEVVWSGPNLTGGVPAVILPSRVTPLRGEDRLWPHLYPEIQMIKLINRVRAKRETRSDNAKPDVLYEQSPEQIRAQAAARQAAAQSGQFQEQELQEVTINDGGVSFVGLPGRPMPWEMQDDPDLDKQEQSYLAELNRYVLSRLETTDPEVLAESKANVYLSYVENRKRQQATMLTNLDYVWKTILEMWLTSIVGYDEEVVLYSSEEVAYGTGKTLEQGERVTIKPSDLANFSERFILKVETRSETEQERRMRVAAWGEEKAMGLASVRQGLKAAGYTDEAAQIRELFLDKAKEAVEPQVIEQVKVAIEEAIRLGSRMLVTISSQAPQLAQAAAGAAAAPQQPGFTPLPTPLTEPSQGGSEAVAV
jgi:hypothetical protein